MQQLTNLFLNDSVFFNIFCLVQSIGACMPQKLLFLNQLFMKYLQEDRFLRATFLNLNRLPPKHVGKKPDALKGTIF